MIEPYQAVVLQACVQEPYRDEDARQQIRNNIWRQLLLFRRFTFSYGRVKLIVLPELATHGLDFRRNRAQMLPHTLQLPGPDSDMYAAAAREFGVYVCSCTWERDEHWPDTYFMTAFLINPAGEIILKQRMFGPPLAGSSMMGLWNSIAEAYGEDGPFGPLPVVDTEIGRIGLSVGGDIIGLESSRALAHRGAELILHPMGERNMESSTHIAAAKRVVAFQNCCYVVSANIGQYLHQFYREPAPSNDEARERLQSSPAWGEFEFMGRSQIIGPAGEMLAFIPAAGESATGAVVDLERLRYERSLGGWPFRMHGEAFARQYESFGGMPATGDADRTRSLEQRKAFLARLTSDGVIKPSEAYA